MKNHIESEIRRTVLLAHEHKGGFLLPKILLNLFPGKMLVKLDIATFTGKEGFLLLYFVVY